MDRNQIKVLIRQMTLEEKAGQVTQLPIYEKYPEGESGKKQITDSADVYDGYCTWVSDNISGTVGYGRII